MKILFAGTPAFAAVALNALLEGAHHQIIAVYTQLDRPAGRGLKLTPSPVKQLALQHHIPVYQPSTLKTVEAQNTIKNLQPDVMVVAAYGMLLPEAVLSLPRFGCINIHPSLLPRWRGAAPIQRTILAGDKLSGVSIMQMDAGLDTGPVLLQHAYTLEEDETSATLHNKLAQMGAESLIETLTLLEQNKLQARPQYAELATYANKLNKAEARLDWLQAAVVLDRQIRGFNPWPMAYAEWQQQIIRIGLARVGDPEMIKNVLPGTIIKASAAGIEVATGTGTLVLLQLQLPGGKMLSVHDFYQARQHDLRPGNAFS